MYSQSLYLKDIYFQVLYLWIIKDLFYFFNFLKFFQYNLNYFNQFHHCLIIFIKLHFIDFHFIEFKFFQYDFNFN